jgi:hypothetical protein
VAAAKRALDEESETTVEVRLAFFERVIEVYLAKPEAMAETIPPEMESSDPTVASGFPHVPVPISDFA